MRKIILGVAISLDGFIEGPKGEYDWCFTDQDYGFKAFMERIDAIFYGRKSYEVMLKEVDSSGINHYSGKEVFVFSNTHKVIKGATVVSGDTQKAVQAIKDGNGKDIWLFGGADLTRSLMNLRLVDELWLAVHPILLGTGKPLFSGIEGKIQTTLTDCKRYETGLVSLTYSIDNNR